MESHANRWRSICPWHDDSDDEHSNSAASKKRRCRDLSWGHSVGRATRGRPRRAGEDETRRSASGGRQLEEGGETHHIVLLQAAVAREVAPAAKPSVVDDDEKASASPPSKRCRGSDEEPPAAPVTQKPPTPGKCEEDAPAVDAPATATRYAPAVAAVTAAALASIAPFAARPPRSVRPEARAGPPQARRHEPRRCRGRGRHDPPAEDPPALRTPVSNPGTSPRPARGPATRATGRGGPDVGVLGWRVVLEGAKRKDKDDPLEEQVRGTKPSTPGWFC